MSRNGDTIQSLGGEDRPFRFGLAEHRRLQEKLNVGVSMIVQSLHPFVTALAAGLSLEQIIAHKLLGDIRIEQVGQVIFEGLVGAGMSPAEAGVLRRDWVDQRPLLESVTIAYTIGLAALVGAEDEPAAGESKGVEPEPLSQTEKSGSAKTASTRSARPAASPRKRSTK